MGSADCSTLANACTLTTALADVDYELFNLLAAHAASSLQGAWLAAELKGKKPQLWAAADLV